MTATEWDPPDAHLIRLRGPWEVQWLSPAGDVRDFSAPEVRRVKLPADWQDLFGALPGTARFTRRFQQPTGLSPDDRVLIVLDQVGGPVELSLNGTRVPPCPTTPPSDQVSHQELDQLRFDVTDPLQATNLLTLDVSFDPTAQGHVPGGLWLPVLLAIRNGGE